MSSIGFIASLILLGLKLAAIGTFATMSWWVVVLPFAAAVVIDIILFAIFGLTMFKMFDRL